MKVIYMCGDTEAVVRHGDFHSTLAFIQKPITPRHRRKKYGNA